MYMITHDVANKIHAHITSRAGAVSAAAVVVVALTFAGVLTSARSFSIVVCGDDTVRVGVLLRFRVRRRA